MVRVVILVKWNIATYSVLNLIPARKIVRVLGRSVHYFNCANMAGKQPAAADDDAPTVSPLERDRSDAAADALFSRPRNKPEPPPKPAKPVTPTKSVPAPPPKPSSTGAGPAAVSLTGKSATEVLAEVQKFTSSLVKRDTTDPRLVFGALSKVNNFGLLEVRILTVLV